jgi:hypothetical protein
MATRLGVPCSPALIVIRVPDGAAAVADFLDSVELPAKQELGVAVNLAAAAGLLASAERAIAAIWPGPSN